MVGVVDLRPADHVEDPGSPRHQDHHPWSRSAIDCRYKSCRLKQYFKEHRALRTETVIGNTRDFDVGRRVNAKNWHALRAVGEHANQRPCDAQAADAQPAPDVVTLNEVTRPSVADG